MNIDNCLLDFLIVTFLLIEFLKYEMDPSGFEPKASAFQVI